MTTTPDKPVTGSTANAALADHEYLALASAMINGESRGGPVPVDPDIADAMGAFHEDALSADDAIDSYFDGVDPTADPEGNAHG